jgi:hypothetical protein
MLVPIVGCEIPRQVEQKPKTGIDIGRFANVLTLFLHVTQIKHLEHLFLLNQSLLINSHFLLIFHCIEC